MSQMERPADHPIQILLVDDDYGVLHALEQALSDRPGQEVVACSTFEDARRRLREQSFDVLITDVRLGAFNGLQLAVLAHDTNPSTHLIVFSGFDDSVLRQEAERLGATYLVKPVTTENLQALIATT